MAVRHHSLHDPEGIVLGCHGPLGARRISHGLDRSRRRGSGPRALKTASRCGCVRRSHSGDLLRYGGLHDGSRKGLVETLVDFRYPGRGLESFVVLRIVTPECPNIREFAGLEAQQEAAVDQFRPGRIFLDLGDDGLVEPWWQDIDQVDARSELAVFLRRHLA